MLCILRLALWLIGVAPAIRAVESLSHGSADVTMGTFSILCRGASVDTDMQLQLCCVEACERAVGRAHKSTPHF
eukprot:2461-Pyramimonas_sp.AAC.1